ncbi:MAG: envelope integrity protein Cei [Actinomycetota bacterium]|nr:envelope integrity protein Cei [Actinomycetota bacterium]
MVSTRRDGRPERYRKRRPVPALVLLAILGVAASIVWVQVLDSSDKAIEALTCNAPPALVPVEGQPAPLAGEALSNDSLDRTPPAPASTSLVRVVNASGRNRQATEVTEHLRELGYGQIAEPTNDTLYPQGSLNCRGQIRFGQQGTTIARTLSILEPCVQLVRDERQDATVDFVIGQKFNDLRAKPEARKVLDQLALWAEANPGNQGGLQADGSAAAPVDMALITAARSTRCG